MQAMVCVDYLVKIALTRYSHDLQLKAYSSTRDCCQIITGVSERGLETEIKYWIQPRRMQPRSKSAKEEIVEYLIVHVGQDNFISFSWLTCPW